MPPLIYVFPLFPGLEKFAFDGAGLGVVPVGAGGDGTAKLIDARPILELVGGKNAYEKFVLDGISDDHNKILCRRRSAVSWGRRILRGNKPGNGREGTT